MKKEKIESSLKSWLKKISKEEIKQEEAIVSWSHSEMNGYQGIFSFYNLYQVYKIDYISLKKNTLVYKPSVSLKEFNEIIIDIILSQKENIRSKISLVLQGIVEEFYSGTNTNSIRKLSKMLKIPKSTLHKVICIIKKEINL